MIIICKHVKYEILLLNRFPNPKWGIPRPALILEMLVFRFYFGAVPSKIYHICKTGHFGETGHLIKGESVNHIR